jgi:hypothetical protein
MQTISAIQIEPNGFSDEVIVVNDQDGVVHIDLFSVHHREWQANRKTAIHNGL